MEFTNRMKELTQNILSSSEERAEELTKLKGETNTLRQERAEALTKIKEETSTLRKEAVAMVHDFHDSRRKSGAQLRKDLAEGRKLLVQSGKQLHKDLAQGPKLLVQNEKKRKQEVGKMLEAFQSSRQESGAELRKELADGKAEMKLEVKTLINGYQSSRQTKGAKDRDERKTDVAGMRQGFRQAQAEVQADLKGAADAWKEMGSPIPKKTSGGKSAPKAQVKMPVEITPNLEEQLLSIINQHAEGITLSEVAKELGIVTIVLGKAAKVLLEQDKVRKEDKIYFPITT